MTAAKFPTVNHAAYLGRMFGLAESRVIMTPQEFDQRYAELRAEFEREQQAVDNFYASETQKQPAR